MCEDLADLVVLEDGSEELAGSTAEFTDEHVDAVHAFHELGPGIGATLARPRLGWWFGVGRALRATLRRAGVEVVFGWVGHDPIAVGRGGRQDTVVRDEVRSGSRDQRGETGDELLAGEDDMGGAIAERAAEAIDDMGAISAESV